jgi:N-acetyl-gamma-glutamyl-phosphate/LysW-gamma-L-alpha-aminoadipyl-6-phosphate reductase
MIKASIVGASGYAGGELLRLLLSHPEVELAQATSESNAGKYIHHVHPNLRGRRLMQFSSINELKECDVLFLALPHGKAMGMMDRFMKIAPKIIDLSADFRLRDAELYKKYYGHEHTRMDLLGKFVYGLPELHREEIKNANLVSGVGCNATSMILPLYPLFKKDIVESVVAEVKAGSSEAGNKPSLGSHHPERSGAVRSFSPTTHRHVAEMMQELGFNGKPEIHFSATSIEMVRGILATCHVFLKRDVTELEVRKIYREVYGNEPFIRIVKEVAGIYRYPEPKILSGSNYCDIGFEKDPDSSRLVVIAAIDNLMKGAAGTAVQCMNLMFGFDERASLEFPGLHPI